MLHSSISQPGFGFPISVIGQSDSSCYNIRDVDFVVMLRDCGLGRYAIHERSLNPLCFIVGRCPGPVLVVGSFYSHFYVIGCC